MASPFVMKLFLPSQLFFLEGVCVYGSFQYLLSGLEKMWDRREKNKY